MSKFIALPVNGDSFMLIRDGKVIVFDGGGNQKKIKKIIIDELFCLGVKNNKIDYLICSHNDSDHANGIIGILSSKKINVGEVWLPAIWSDINSYVESDDNCYNELFKECFCFNLFHDEKLLNKENRKNNIENSKKENHSRIYKKKIELKEDIAHYKSIIPLAIQVMLGVEFLPVFMISIILFYKKRKKVNRIIEIMKLAKGKKITIKWFCYETQTPQGGVDILEPMNSVEIKPRKNSDKSLFLLSELSIENKESLVFKSSFKDENDVIFTSDSDFAWLHNKNNQNKNCDALVTAPHHGSPSNSKVYSYFSENCIFVRSGNLLENYPCPEYKNLINKFCTICNNANQKKTILKFVIKNGKWTSQNNQPKCSCR